MEDLKAIKEELKDVKDIETEKYILYKIKEDGFGDEVIKE